jgi:hypothetical protein
MSSIALNKLKSFIERGPSDVAESDKYDEKLVQDVVAAMEDGNIDSELIDLMTNFDPENNPPEWVTSKKTWERAKRAVDPNGKGAKYSEPWAVVAHVYRKMGGGVA